jgi:hypothetical protein
MNVQNKFSKNIFVFAKKLLLLIALSTVSGCGWMKYTEEYDNPKQSSTTPPLVPAVDVKKSRTGYEFNPNGIVYQKSFVKRYKVAGNLSGSSAESMTKSMRGYKVYTTGAGVFYSEQIRKEKERKAKTTK